MQSLILTNILLQDDAVNYTTSDHKWTYKHLYVLNKGFPNQWWRNQKICFIDFIIYVSTIKCSKSELVRLKCGVTF